MEKKNVLIDICDISNPTCGFGQIAKNYAARYAHLQDDDLQFHFLFPRKYPTEQIPDELSSFRRGSKDLPHFDIWHSTTQHQLRHKRGKCDKFILTIHDLNYLTEKNWLRQLKHKFILQRGINKAAAVTCISKFVGKQVEEHFNLKGKPVRVIYNGVEDIASDPQEKPAFATGRPFFFAIGQIRKKKNFHLLVDMMEQFPDHDLYICGDDHFDFSATVRKHISQLPTHNAFLCGKISAEEKVWLYAHCEAFLFASQGEGFGLPAIEAMQFGKPVFISNCTCLPEICGDCAYIWDSLEPKDMAFVIKQHLPNFYAKPDLAAQVKAHAAEFSYEKHIEAYIQLYKEIAND